MKRMILGLTVAAAAAFAAPHASAADIEIQKCGITPRIPCGVCITDPTLGQTCLPGPIQG
jgi:hypothetical protein